MKIDKELLMNYLIYSKEDQYILNLYKIYSLSDKITNHDIYKEKNILDNYEDEIYKVKDKVLTEKERIFFEFRRIVNQYSASNKKNKTINKELDSLITLIKQCNFDDSNSVLEVKQKISILEARLNISINYFYSASVAFLDIYNSINDDLINEVNNYNLYDKKYVKEINKNINNDIKNIDVFNDKKVE